MDDINRNVYERRKKHCGFFEPLEINQEKG
jgi:hypothetical protein